MIARAVALAPWWALGEGSRGMPSGSRHWLPARFFQASDRVASRNMLPKRSYASRRCYRNQVVAS